MERVSRSFEDSEAVRGGTPLLVGLAGPSGGGKTYSALRLATGMQRVVGGDIFGIDSESKRMLHYADKFKFRHVPFAAPFSPLDYWAAISHCVEKGAKTIIIDSMSHEHEGPGGVLEEHASEVERLMAAWHTTEGKATMAAWAKPKAKRRRLISNLMQVNCNFILCFRAKEKMKIVTGKDPVLLGFMPIAGEEFVFEMTCNALLMPNANGVPTWNPIEVGERQMVKLPQQFKEHFKPGKQFDEDAGEFMARWAAGTAVAPIKDAAMRATEMVKEYADCDFAALQRLETERELIWKKIPTDQKTTVKLVADLAKTRLGVT